MNLRIFDTTNDLLAAAARTLVQRVQGGARTVALSGGSTPKPMYAMLGSSPMHEQLAEFPITWVVVDERYLPIDDPESNAGMMQKTLFANGMSLTHRFLRFRTELNDPAATARTFEDEWRTLNIAQLDLVCLGIGDDGHTASLFPGTPVVVHRSRRRTGIATARFAAGTLASRRLDRRRPRRRMGGSRQPVLPAKFEGLAVRQRDAAEPAGGTPAFRRVR